MKYKITSEERALIKYFRSLRIPAIFKFEYIDYMLFVEQIDFYVCRLLLKGKEITGEIFAEVMQGNDTTVGVGFNCFVNSIDVSILDEATLEYYHNILRVVEVMRKYYEKTRN